MWVPALVMASLAQCFHVIGAQWAVHAIISDCVAYQWVAGKPHHQLWGQLQRECLDVKFVFDQVGVNYAGPILTKSRSKHRPIIAKGYICILVSFFVKAIHIEPITELNTVPS